MEKKNASRKAQRAARARKQRNRRIALTLCLLLVVCAASIGGTLAWLTASTTLVVNTFTTSDVSIELAETTSDYKMVPGNTIAKDPKVTVKAGSEACWLFVKIEKSTNYGTYLADYVVADGWTALTGVDGVYYREVDAVTADTSFDVLKDNQVKVLDSVTKADMTAAQTSAPTLTFTAYACQKDNVTSAADAWAKINPGT